MIAKRLGHLLYAAGLAGLGLLSLINRDFALNWQPVPSWVPWRVPLACASGAILLGGGLALLGQRFARVAAVILTLFVLSWLLLLQVPRVAASPGDVGVWLGFCETTLLVAGGWLLILGLPAAGGARWTAVTGPRAARAARLLFAAALPMIGVSHFVYLKFTAQMVPAWLPFRPGWACLTGAGHIAAGVGLLLGIVPRLAAVMEALMLSCFVLLLHVPGVAAAPGDRLQWTMLCVATAYCGAAWVVAGSWREAPGALAAAPA